MYHIVEVISSVPFLYRNTNAIISEVLFHLLNVIVIKKRSTIGILLRFLFPLWSLDFNEPSTTVNRA